MRYATQRTSPRRARCAAGGLSSGIAGLTWPARIVFLFGVVTWAPQIVTAAEVVQQKPVVLDVDKAELIQLAEPATTVFVANPDVADIQIPNPTSFLIFGKKPGSTTAYAFTRGGKVTSYVITVNRQITGILDTLRKAVPAAAIDVTSAPTGVTISGSVPSPRDAERLKAAARQYLGEKENMIFNVTVDSPTQVNLRVRVAEVTRTASKMLGVNWGAVFNNGNVAVGLLTGRVPVSSFGTFLRDPSTNMLDSIGVGYQSGSANLSALLDALQSEGLVTVLAEPNLTAISGETASFLAGGEFPIPISQGNLQISIEFKRFGVSVDFTPVVLDANRITIKVRPEVSELSTVGAVVIDSIQIPSLAVRRAETTVELASGQSFAIAGLFQNNVSNSIQQLPWLGDVPVLGALFRSLNFQRSESELVIIVTPYIVKPVAQTSALHLPTEGIMFPSDLEIALRGRLTTLPDRPPTSPLPATSAEPHLSGAAGFMLE
jgi:pilus assembly protein CpaC